MVKKLVRLALASEYSRLPIRRNDISAKVLGEHGSRQFKLVFDQAQREMRQRFGMEMSELPAREKVTISQRRGELDSMSCFSLLQTHAISEYSLLTWHGIPVLQPRRKLKSLLRVTSPGSLLAHCRSHIVPPISSSRPRHPPSTPKAHTPACTVSLLR